MSIDWINKKDREGSALFLDNSITFNTPLLSVLDTVMNVMVGVDKEKKEVIIKPIEYAKVVRGDYSKDSIYKLSISRSYARITNKNLIEQIEKELDTKVVKNKFCAHYDLNDKLIIIEAREGVKHD